ncbi:MAG: MerR family transcriptional regulator [Acidobacteriota bacterium]
MATHHPIRKTVHAPSPEIPDKLYFRIGDVARLCEVPAYVLRFWETEFPQLKPNKGGTGQRLYRRKDVEMALRIKSLLYDQGYTIPGARQVFKSELQAVAKAKESGPFAAPEPTPEPIAIAAPAPVPTPVAATNVAPISTLRRDAQLQTLRDEMRSLLTLLGNPVSTKPAESKVKTMRPRLVLEPKPDPRRNQGDLFSLE